ncbi:MAG: flavodoxin [Oscillochloridaceae bacterium]|nr:flavodoxin [Chloroflexaceae bacterium]MDW8389647.1 flavodoxin [Oscillochloridaceae bacterium]
MIAIVYGSSTDNTRGAALDIADTLRKQVSTPIDVFDVAAIKEDLRPLLNYRVLLLGCPTWNVGELQDDWYDAFPQLDDLDFEGITAALFGCGDQRDYPDNFQDALGILGRKLRERGATIIGRWPTDGYDFYESAGVEDGMFFGLALDEINQTELSGERIRTWVTQIVAELNPALLATQT